MLGNTTAPANGDASSASKGSANSQHGATGRRAISGETAAARLRARLDTTETPSKPWQPEPGDELVGIVAGWSSGTTRRGETHPILLVDAEDGTRWACWAFYAVLRDELRKANPQPGELILIRRGDDRTGPNGGYRVYRVAVDRDADPFADAAAPLDQDAPGDWKLAEGGAR